MARGESPDVDGRVARCLAAGDDRGAAEAIAQELGPALRGYLCAVLRSEDDAGEVFADVCEQVLKNVGGFRGESTVKTWAYRIAWRTAMHFRRSPGRRRAAPLRTEDVSGIAQPARSATAQHLRTDAKDWLARIREELSIEDQSLLTLRVDRGLSWNDVAVVMGDGDVAKTSALLRKRFERIKERLRAAAMRDGLVEER